MCITTKLRVLRLKYKISLMELAKQGGLSNQQISHMELGDIPRTKHKEQLAAAALSRVIAARRASLDSLEREYQASKGQLLTPMEENDHEL
ncbi:MULTISPECIES: helix-turn-helix domain-containing protein [Eubacteriales]|uniref:helix-turn-helix domain-containing protein n=1 Tax=Eubacteriales TaxID=186802 RepID=UPI001D062A31|nr:MULTISPECIES: helix-turn-helix transcriptional regulator [Eubacteriales]MBS6216845.1 helix-turn-helix transcriptional regulator [Clostridiales bacterium]MCB7039946.1 helix-turn-helix domain-containing protein [Flavonifractor plautii]MCB7049828.1 helix-turn-helix domain-containing protein [Intestinimonas butyriciproducens]